MKWKSQKKKKKGRGRERTEARDVEPGPCCHGYPNLGLCEKKRKKKRVKGKI